MDSGLVPSPFFSHMLLPYSLKSIFALIIYIQKLTLSKNKMFCIRIPYLFAFQKCITYLLSKVWKSKVWFPLCNQIKVGNWVNYLIFRSLIWDTFEEGMIPLRRKIHRKQTNSSSFLSLLWNTGFIPQAKVEPTKGLVQTIVYTIVHIPLLSS